MNSRSIIFFTVCVAAQTLAHAQIVKFNSALDEIIAPDAKVEKVTDNPGMTVLEGPVWNRKGSYLLFSDFATKSINKWNSADGKITRFLDRSGSNGVTLDAQGRVVFCAQSDGQIARIEEDGRRVVLAGRYEGKRLNGPNDLVYKSDGALYFTDNTVHPPFTINDTDPSLEIPFNGVYLLKGGKVTLLFKGTPRPNGIVLSPDEKHLYVDDTLTKVIWRFDVKPDDTVANGQVWFRFGTDMPHLPDGIKVDEKGNLYSSGPGGLWILSPDAKLLGIFLTPALPNNLTFGDADGKSLFLATPGGIYRLRVKLPGIRP